MSFRVFTSNRLETLAQALIEVLSKPPESPFEPDVVVVQSRGMERWLSLTIAEKTGICAHVQFPFPNVFVHELAQRVLPDFFPAGTIGPDATTAGPAPGSSQKTLFDPPVLTWKIMQVLPELLRGREFEPLKNYLTEPDRDLKLLQLCRRIADLFDQYLLFRDEMIFEWERGKDSRWQAQLWRKISSEVAVPHRAQIGRELIRRLTGANLQNQPLPVRVNVFGISALPKFHLQVLHALSNRIPVNLFLMNPCREFWLDIRSRKEIAQISESRQLTIDFQSARDDLYYTVGHGLLASLGQLGREFFTLVEDFDNDEISLFAEPPANTLLTTLQSDILNLRNREDGQTAKAPVSKDDDSVQIHACHSERREIEVLHDQLLHLFDRCGDLKPGDILVMAPDIELYAPYIQATFDRPRDARDWIPYSIADRSLRKENDIIEAFFAILDLQDSRFTASEVFHILEMPVIHENFGLQEEELGAIKFWLQDSGIRWGKDARQRAKLGLPEIAQNTWRAGMERLLLGYAMGDEEQRAFQNAIVPYDKIEGSEAIALGHVLEFLQRLFFHTDLLQHKATLNRWQEIFLQLVDSFFVLNENTVQQIQALRSVIQELQEYQSLSDFDENVPLKVVRHFLQSEVSSKGHGPGFLSGGVTFCSMLPMRSIPARVLCLIGMNYDAYPRTQRPLGFDLIAREPQPGDRSRRKDDRYLFLEALLSAREYLYISYIGQSMRDNSVIPPSVLVSELLDHIHSNFVFTESETEAPLLVRHKLQAFNPAYFVTKTHPRDALALFSYSESNKKAAERLLSSEKMFPSFFPENLPPPDERYKEVTISELVQFLKEPQKTFFRKRCGFTLTDEEDLLEDSELFTLKGLDRYKLADVLLQKELAGEDLTPLMETTRLAGVLPHGEAGEHLLTQLLETTRAFADRLRKAQQGNPLQPWFVDCAIAGFRVTGKLDAVFSEWMLHCRYAVIRPKDHLSAWVKHLFLNLSAPPEYPKTTLLAGTNKPKEQHWLAYRLKPVADPAAVLEHLLQLYWRGLTRPIRFFPKSAHAYARSFKESQNPTEALKKGRSEWFSREAFAERKDPHIQRCFGHEEDPLDDEFRALATEVFRPLLEHEEEVGGEL